LSEEYRESGEDIAMQYNKYKVWKPENDTYFRYRLWLSVCF
jgi:hypothetical protein